MKRTTWMPLTVLALVLTLLFAAMPAKAAEPAVVASGWCGEDAQWTFKENGVLTISGTGNMADYSSRVNTPWWDYRGQLTTVTVETGITAIGTHAFEGTNLNKVNLPATLTSIGEESFRDTNLKSVVIPSKVTAISRNAFRGCSMLQTVTMKGSVKTIADEAFQGCSTLSVVLPKSVTKIGDRAFLGCSQIYLRTGIESLGYYCFSDANVWYAGTSAEWDNLDDGYCAPATLTCLNLQSEVYAKLSSTAKVKVQAVTGATYQWQFKASKDAPWKNVSSASGKTATYSLKTAVRHNGYLYRCIVTLENGEKLTCSQTKLVLYGITAQPEAVTATAGNSASFTVKAIGKGLTYRWQAFKPGGSWKNVSSANTGYNKATLKITAKAALDGYKYRCVVKDAEGHRVVSSAVTFTVKSVKPAITAQPTAKTVTEGTKAVFKVTASGTELKYQWQYKAAGSSTWKSVSAASGKTAAYSLKAEARHNGYQYRCKVTNSAGSVFSKAVKLTVK